MKRNNTVDTLRCLGTFLVILAHTNPPAILASIRTFDVCLLVMISGYCSSYKGDYGAYVVKRIKRLCVPAWKMMTLIFIVCFCLCVVSHKTYIYSARQVLETYMFIGGMEGGIGLFWIIRIYLLVALLTPVANRIGKAPFWVAGMSVAALLAINQECYAMLWNRTELLNILVENVIMSGLAYMPVYIVGIAIRANRSVPKIMLATGSAFFILEAVFRQGYFSNTAAFKYPPQLAYVIYGIFASTLLWLIVDHLNVKSLPKWVTWVSANSLNLYLAHALLMKLLSWGDKYVSRIPLVKNWFILFCLVMSGSAFLVYLWTLKKRGKSLC